MIRDGERGEGKWRRVGWDEALDYTAERLKEIMARHGSKSVLFSDRGGPFRDLHQAFVRGLGSPNYSNHDSSCARNVMHAAQSLFGFGRKDVVYDLKNARHVVLQTRNIFESINVKEANDLMTAIGQGCKLTVIDIRATLTATKADRFFLVRPGTDYALNLAVIHELLSQRLHDMKFTRMYIKDLKTLQALVEPYTPAWAAAETGIAAERIIEFVRDLAEAKPAVIWHPGWMTARYRDSFYVSRSIYMINALLGAIGSKGGLPLANKPGDVGRKGLKKLADLVPKPKEPRADGVGLSYPHFDAGPGLLHLAFKAMETEDPYPLKAYIAYRHDPLMGYPEPERLKAHLLEPGPPGGSDLQLVRYRLVRRRGSAAFSLPRTGKHPGRQKWPEALLFPAPARRGAPHLTPEPIGKYSAAWPSGWVSEPLAFNSIQDIWDYQLEGTGVTMKDFEATGMVALTDQAIYQPRDNLKFKTPSGKIEVISTRWENHGIPSLKPYESPTRPETGTFRLTFGRCAVHTQGHTVNNPLLHELMPENVLWINDQEAAKLGIKDGDYVEVSSNGHAGRLKAKVTPLIHPEAVFMVHGFGHTLPVESRALGKGWRTTPSCPEGWRCGTRRAAAWPCKSILSRYAKLRKLDRSLRPHGRKNGSFP